MRATDFVECRKYAERWWPGIEWPLDEDVVRKFDRIPPTVGRAAVDRLVESMPDRRPSVASFLKACREEWRKAPKVSESPESCRHGTWAILGPVETEFERVYGKSDMPDFRVCVFCKWGEWGRFVTVGESEPAKGQAA